MASSTRPMGKAWAKLPTQPRGTFCTFILGVASGRFLSARDILATLLAAACTSPRRWRWCFISHPMHQSQPWQAPQLVFVRILAAPTAAILSISAGSCPNSHLMRVSHVCALNVVHQSHCRNGLPFASPGALAGLHSAQLGSASFSFLRSGVCFTRLPVAFRRGLATVLHNWLQLLCVKSVNNVNSASTGRVWHEFA